MRYASGGSGNIVVVKDVVTCSLWCYVSVVVVPVMGVWY